MTRTKKHDVLGTVEYTPVFQFIISDKDLLERTKQKVMPLIISVVLGRMWRHAWGDKGMCTASQINIAEDLGLSVSTVQRAIYALEDMHLITDLDKGKRTFANGQGRPHRYLVNIDSILAKHFTWRRKNGLPEDISVEEVPAPVENTSDRPEDSEIKVVNVRELKRRLKEE
jgi:DNA-binding transcriptional ArsR family regulator